MSDDFKSNPLVSTEWLADHIDAPDLRIVDASYYMPGEGLDPRQEFELHHIPGSVFFDIDDIADSDSALPHMLPSPQKFSSRVRKLGLGDGLRFVIYDQKGVWSAPRVWWTFRHFGHEDVAVLDGGLPKWMDEGREIESGPAQPGERHFTARVNSFTLRDKDQMTSNLQSARDQVLDARPAGHFLGQAPEPRAGLRQGHIPGSLNLPYQQLMHSETRAMRPAAELKDLFTVAGIDLAQPVVTTCGSGITAAILALGLTLIGHRDVALYDGSWAEWGLPGETPIESEA